MTEPARSGRNLGNQGRPYYQFAPFYRGRARLDRSDEPCRLPTSSRVIAKALFDAAQANDWGEAEPTAQLSEAAPFGVKRCGQQRWRPEWLGSIDARRWRWEEPAFYPSFCSGPLRLSPRLPTR